ncbi:ABC transporter substrate-binding protein [Lentzea flava]|uniref:ABC transporter substrate-binding protein n=1 Tax=Lentzea flava TaxID=103732 RepID=A0ABQ2ULB3_9PSEU|nr:extracellular solute-binding protein [Lentzea flava]MCP2200551.1 cellobiose-binding protein [Lentzea flava]GGU43443.1 ABC transporter substrate-binding protein [Lentzea flava]
MTVRSTRALLATTLLGALVATSACGGGGTADAGNGTTTLVVKTFSQFGYADLYKEYEAGHPGVTIKEENIGKLGDYTPKLQQWLATGTGAGDVVAIEEGILTQFMAKPDQFVNLLDHGAGALKGNFLEWKWNQASTPDGSKVIGLGTDVGAQGMCYRTDLFARAGLPTNREEVGKLWPTWDDYLATGKRFKEKNTGAAFYDSSTGLYQNILMQQGDHTYYDKSNKLVIDSNPGVKKAWDQTINLVQAGLSANIEQWSPQWNAGFKNGGFATIPCPSWMLGTIEKQSGPENSGRWDVARVPGNGAVRGGSFLAVPTQSKHQTQAAELVKFLTSAKGQIAAFKAKNNFPSSPQAIDDAAVQAYTNPYFSDAPVGRIFGDSVKALKPVYLGPANLAIGDRVGNALTAVEQGKLKPDEAWAKAVDEARRLVK